MSATLLGWFLIAIGTLFILTGFARAARETFSTRHAIEPPAGIKSLLGDVAKILEALAKLPQWLLMVAVGGYLIYAGQQILVGQRPWPF